MASSIYKLDLKLLKKRAFLRYSILFLMNSFVLLFTYYNMPEKNNDFLGFILILLSLFIFIFLRNFQRQIKIFSSTAFEIREKTLKLYGENATCTDVDLRGLKNIKRQNFLGIDRIILYFENKKLNYFAIENMDEFQRELEKESGISGGIVNFNFFLLSIKFFIIYLPSFITIFFMRYYESKITKEILYLILNLNTIFLVQHISEDKLEGGISSKTARRVIIILSILFFFQMYKVFF